MRMAGHVPQTDKAGSPGALTRAAPSPRRTNAAYTETYMCVCVCAYCSLSSLPFFARLRCWTGGGGEKQLDGTNDVTNNTSSRTHSHCGKQTIANITHPWSDC